MKIRSTLLLAVATPMLFAANAFALSVGLNVSNMDPSYTSPTPYVTVDGTAGTDSYTFTVTPGSGINMDAFYFNTDLSLSSSNFEDSQNNSILPTDWFLQESRNADGFGQYDYKVYHSQGWPDPTLTSLSFTIINLSNTPTDSDFYVLSSGSENNGYGHFAAHVIGAPEFNGNTYFVRDGGGTPTPEPATMLLFGSGLIGLAGASRRRKKNKNC